MAGNVAAMSISRFLDDMRSANEKYLYNTYDECGLALVDLRGVPIEGFKFARSFPYHRLLSCDQQLPMSERQKQRINEWVHHQMRKKRTTGNGALPSTLANHLGTIRRLYVVNEWLGFPIHKMADISLTHLFNLVLSAEYFWRAEGTHQNRFSTIRHLYAVLDREEEFEVFTQEFTKHFEFFPGQDRVQHATWNHSLKAAGITIERLLDAMGDAHWWIRAAIELQFRFGLRIRESVCFNPSLNWDQTAKVLRVTPSMQPKGLRPRDVYVHCPESQIEAITRITNLLRLKKHSAIAPDGVSVSGAIQAVRNQFRKTARSLGLYEHTPHALRHTYIHDLLHKLGAPIPIASVDSILTQADQQKAYLFSMLQLGHGVIGKVEPYVGKLPDAFNKIKGKRHTEWSQAEHSQEALAKHFFGDRA